MSNWKAISKKENQVLERIRSKLEIENPRWLGVLVGNDISSKVISFIEENSSLKIDDEEISLFALTIKRYKSDDGQIFTVSETYQKPNKRDYTKYIFKGKKYVKNRLVLALFQDYVQKNPGITYADLKKKFEDTGYPHSPYFIPAREAKRKYRNSKPKHKRHFIEPSELIRLPDEIIAVSDQWGWTKEELKFIIEEGELKSLGYSNHDIKEA